MTRGHGEVPRNQQTLPRRGILRIRTLTPYLFNQAININHTRSSSRGHSEKKRLRAVRRTTPSNHSLVEGSNPQRMPPPIKSWDRVKRTRTRRGTRREGRRAERQTDDGNNTLPTTPKNKHHRSKSPKTDCDQKGATHKIPPPRKLGDRVKKARRRGGTHHRGNRVTPERQYDAQRVE